MREVDYDGYGYEEASARMAWPRENCIASEAHARIFVMIPVPTVRMELAWHYEFMYKALTSLATLSEGEARADLGGDVVYKFANHFDIIAGHNHLVRSIRGTLWPVKASGNIGGTDEELRAVVGHERRVTTTLVLRQDLHDLSAAGVKNDERGTYVDLGNELRHRLD